MLKTKHSKAPTLRDIKIKTGVVKRTGQELVMYQKEKEKQKERIVNLIKNGADSHDISKQNEVLEETVLMLPDCKARLVKAHKELTDLVALLLQAQTEAGTEAAEVPEEITLARQILSENAHSCY